jgi:hypothetical protein
MGFMETKTWDWDSALRQFEINRHEFNSQRRRRSVGFGNSREESSYD